MKLLHLLLALLIATLFLACNSDKETLQVETNITAYSNDIVELDASGAKAYSWRQLSGTSVVLVNAKSATASFIAPDVSTEETLVFELEAVTPESETTNTTVKKEVNVRVLPKLAEIETNTTQTGVSLKSLKLSIEKTSLNVDENTSLQVIANYEDNTTKDVTDEVEWILSDTNAAKISQKSLHAKKDTNIFLQAKLNAITSNAVALEIYKEISGHRLPPEPDSTINNATLLGVDTNDNGVRDDVERWIYEEYKEKHPIHIDIAMQAGRAYKQVLETPERALEIREKVNGPLFCASYYQFDAEEFGDKKLINERIDAPVKSKYFNTKERSDVYWEYDTLLSGGSYDLPWDMKKYCDFNTSTYK